MDQFGFNKSRFGPLYSAGYRALQALKTHLVASNAIFIKEYSGTPQAHQKLLFLCNWRWMLDAKLRKVYHIMLHDEDMRV